MENCPLELVEFSEYEIKQIQEYLFDKNLNIPITLDTIFYQIFNEEGVNFEGGEIIEDYSRRVAGFEILNKPYFISFNLNSPISEESFYEIFYGDINEIIDFLEYHETSESKELIKKVNLLDKWIDAKNLTNELNSQKKHSSERKPKI